MFEKNNHSLLIIHIPLFLYFSEDFDNTDDIRTGMDDMLEATISQKNDGICFDVSSGRSSGVETCNTSLLCGKIPVDLSSECFHSAIPISDKLSKWPISSNAKGLDYVIHDDKPSFFDQDGNCQNKTDCQDVLQEEIPKVLNGDKVDPEKKSQQIDTLLEKDATFESVETEFENGEVGETQTSTAFGVIDFNTTTGREEIDPSYRSLEHVGTVTYPAYPQLYMEENKVFGQKAFEHGDIEKVELSEHNGNDTDSDQVDPGTGIASGYETTSGHGEKEKNKPFDLEEVVTDIVHAHRNTEADESRGNIDIDNIHNHGETDKCTVLEHSKITLEQLGSNNDAIDCVSPSTERDPKNMSDDEECDFDIIGDIYSVDTNTMNNENDIVNIAMELDHVSKAIDDTEDTGAVAECSGSKESSPIGDRAALAVEPGNCNLDLSGNVLRLNIDTDTDVKNNDENDHYVSGAILSVTDIGEPVEGRLTSVDMIQQRDQNTNQNYKREVEQYEAHRKMEIDVDNEFDNGKSGANNKINNEARVGMATRQNRTVNVEPADADIRNCGTIDTQTSSEYVTPAINGEKYVLPYSYCILVYVPVTM